MAIRRTESMVPSIRSTIDCTQSETLGAVVHAAPEPRQVELEPGERLAELVVDLARDLVRSSSRTRSSRPASARSSARERRAFSSASFRSVMSVATESRHVSPPTSITSADIEVVRDRPSRSWPANS